MVGSSAVVTKFTSRTCWISARIFQ